MKISQAGAAGAGDGSRSAAANSSFVGGFIASVGLRAMKDLLASLQLRISSSEAFGSMGSETSGPTLFWFVLIKVEMDGNGRNTRPAMLARNISFVRRPLVATRQAFERLSGGSPNGVFIDRGQWPSARRVDEIELRKPLRARER